MRRRLATTRHAATRTASTTKPHCGRKLSAPGALTPMSKPNRSGRGTDAPAAPPETAELASTSSSTATAMARVATARVMPRTRVAGRPMSTPSSTATAVAATRASRNGQPSSTIWIDRNPATPAMASWAREIWPL